MIQEVEDIANQFIFKNSTLPDISVDCILKSWTNRLLLTQVSNSYMYFMYSAMLLIASV